MIAAVRGFALGGGFELVLACDLVVAAENARFGLPEPRLGLAPGGGGTQRLPRIVGKARAFEVLLAGRVADRAGGLRVGHREPGRAQGATCSPPPRSSPARCSRSRPRRSQRSSAIAQEGLALPLAEALTLEQDETAQLIATPDALEGIAAFVEKREPRFPGRRRDPRPAAER